MRQQTVLGGRYVLGDELGRGGIGVVYVARDLQAGRLVAIKVLRSDHTADAEALARFEQEARIARQLSHENIARVYDFGQDGAERYLVLELLGPTLKELLAKRGRLPPGAAVRIVQQVLAGLAAAHARGIVHRDVKPQNVLFTNDWTPEEPLTVKLVDFGIARIASAPSRTRAGQFFGTAYYVSPEQALGRPAGPTSDIYSAGVVLYELLTGEVPFGGSLEVEILRRHADEAPTPPSRRAPGISPRLDAIVLRALEKTPERRWPSAESMRAALAGADAPGLHADAGTTRAYTAATSAPTSAVRTSNGHRGPILGQLRGVLRSSPDRGATTPLATIGPPRPGPARGTPAPAWRLGKRAVVALLVLAMILTLGVLAVGLADVGVGSAPQPATPRGGPGQSKVVLAAEAFDGGCFGRSLPGRLVGATLLLGQASGCYRAVAQFELVERPAGAAVRLSAIASPLEAPEIAVFVNDRQAFRGRLALPDGGGRGEVTLPVPDGLLRTGRNRLEIRSLDTGPQPELGAWLLLFGAEVIYR